MTDSITPRRKAGRIGSLRYSHASIFNALDIHVRRRRIKSYSERGKGVMIHLNSGQVVVTASLRETALFVFGVAAGAHAEIEKKATGR